jgi:hypothetical protein
MPLAKVTLTARICVGIPHLKLVSGFLSQEGAFLQFFKSLLELSLSVHDNRAIPGYGLLERFARNEQEPYPFVAGLHRDLITRVKENQ